MMQSSARKSVLIVACLWLASWLAPVTAQAAGHETLTNTEGPVRVSVTPLDLSPGARSWEFEIVMNTHTTPLDQDMQGAAVLVGDAGAVRQPLAWMGDPPGGHHRRGILQFEPLSERPAWLELRISGVGGVNERSFRWRLRH